MATSDTVPGSVATSANVQQDSVDPYGPWGIAKALAGGGGGGGGGGVALAQTSVVTSDHSAIAGEVVRADISGGSLTATLPHAPAAGTLVTVKVTATAAGNVNACTVACAGADVINKAGGSTSILLTRQGQSVLLEYSSGVWAVIATDDGATALATVRQGTFYADEQAGTDDQKMTAALAAAVAAGGGIIVLSARAHTFAAQWTTTYSAGAAAAVKIQGAGVAYNGAWGSPRAATTVTFTYSGAGAACMNFQHLGTIELTGIQIKSANLGVPLFQTTNATPNIHDNVFSGGGAGVSCVTDAIVLGGTTVSIGAGDTAKYNAYQGIVHRNFFDGVRRCVLLNDATNAVIVEKNTVSTSCGSALPLGAPFEIDASARGVTNVYIQQNCVEISHYRVGIYCHGNSPNGATQCTLGPNGYYDSTAITLCAVYLDAISTINDVVDGYHDATYPFVIDNRGNSTVRTSSQNFPTVFPNRYQFTNPGLSAPAATFQGHSVSFPGSVNIENAGHAAGLLPVAPTLAGYPSAYVWTAPGTIVTDGNTVTGGYWVTSATAAFVLADTGYVAAGTGIPTRSIIQATFSATTAPYWLASTPFAAGDITRPPTSNAHLYQCTVAGTSGSSAPTWPTGGTTVTDGGVTWLDLGTGVTAAYLSAACTATNTGVTVTFGRPGTAAQMTGFSAHHIISSGSVPVLNAVGASAGSGATASYAGNDLAHQVTLTTGTSPATGTVLTTNFALAFGAAPKGILITPTNAAAAAAAASVYVSAVTTTHYGLSAGVALPASTAHTWNVTAIQ